MDPFTLAKEVSHLSTLSHLEMLPSVHCHCCQSDLTVQSAHSLRTTPGVIINQKLGPGAGEALSKAKVQIVDSLFTRRKALF